MVEADGRRRTVGFVELASNRACPLAAMLGEGHAAKDVLRAVPPFDALEPLDALSGKSAQELAIFVGAMLALPWFVVVPLLRSRGRGGEGEDKTR